MFQIPFQSGNIFAIICGACQRLIEPNLPKKSKKRPHIQTQNEHLIALDEVITQVGVTFESLQEFFKLYETDNIKSLEGQFSDLDVQGDSSSKAELRIQIEDSYSKTFFNFNNVIKSKLEYLKTLQL